MPIYFYDANNQPAAYTGAVTATVTHNPMGFAEFTRQDPYWNGASVVTQTNTYVQGARVSHTGASPPYGTSITFQVAGVTQTTVNLGIYSFGTATLTVIADGKSDSDSVSDIWIQGRATTYSDTDPPAGATYVAAIPYASQEQYLRGSSITIRNVATPATTITATISWPGPMVPLSPYYPPNDQSWNHYWGSGGKPPVAQALNGKVRAIQIGGVDSGDYQFSSQIIDLDILSVDPYGRSCASKLGITGSGTVQWKF